MMPAAMKPGNPMIFTNPSEENKSNGFKKVEPKRAKKIKKIKKKSSVLIIDGEPSVSGIEVYAQS